MKYDFSVLIPISDKERPSKLKRCLDSVINQTLKPNEIVVVKDGNFSDELNQILNNYKLKIIDLKEHKGTGYALNIGVNKCKYDLIARMDSDDISLPNRFELQIERFKQNDNLVLVGGQILEFDNKKFKSIRKVPTDYLDIIKFSKSRNPFNHMSVMFKKTAILEIGNYKNLPYFEDYYLWIQLLKNNYYVENLEDIIVLANNTSSTIKNRGGFKYIKPSLIFQKNLLKQKYINIFTFIKNVMIRIFVSVIPNKTRSLMYKRIFRKGINEKINKYYSSFL